jgi:RimJ/RimL family protein N-acetyltransferase
MPTLPPRVFDRLCDRSRGHSLVAGHDGQVVAVASLMFTPDPGIAEIAFLVEDRWQGRGIGTAMARMIMQEARDLGFAEVRASLLFDNARMRRLLTSLGATLTHTEDPGVMEARIAVGVMAASSS